MTSSKINSLNDAAKECFVSGDWRQAEEIYQEGLQGLNEELERNDINLESLALLIDYSKLLFLKERNDECRKLTLKILDILEKKFPDQLNFRIEANVRMAETLSFFEDMDETLAYLDKAQELAKERSEADQKDGLLATILSTYAAFVLSNENHDKFSEVESRIEEAENVLSQNSITSGEDVANVLATKAIFVQLKGMVEEAQEYYIKALDAIEEVPLSPSFGEACFGYATLRATDSKFTQSLQFLEDRIKKKEKDIGKDHPILKRAISALALTYSACGELDEAEIQAQRYNQIVELMGNPGVELKIDCLRILIDILQQQSRFSEAQALLTRANDLAESIGNEIVLVRLVMDLARLKLDLGDFEDSVSLYEKALQITKRIKGEDHFETAICLGLLGNAYFAIQSFEKAEEHIRKSIALSSQQEEFFGNLLGADNYRYLGLVCLHQNKLEEAEDALLKALALLEATEMADTLQVAETLKNMGELYETKEELEAAKNHYQRAYKLAKQILGENNFEVADYLSCLADISRKQEAYKEAELLYDQALKIFENTLGPSHPRTCIVLQRFGEISIEQNKYDQAEKFFQAALTRMEQILGSSHPDVGYTSYCLGATYHWKENYTKAENFYRKALSIKEEQLGLKHPDLATIIEPLIDVLHSQGKQDQANSLNRRMIEITGYDSHHEH